jgi:hypothetical protein
MKKMMMMSPTNTVVNLLPLFPELRDDNPQSSVLCCYHTSTRAQSASGMHENACETPK